jgi:hypothetical protein
VNVDQPKAWDALCEVPFDEVRDAWFARVVVTRKRRIALGVTWPCASASLRVAAARHRLAISSTCTLGAAVTTRGGLMDRPNTSGVSTCASGDYWDRAAPLCVIPATRDLQRLHRAGTPYCRRLFSTNAYFRRIPSEVMAAFFKISISIDELFAFSRRSCSNHQRQIDPAWGGGGGRVGGRCRSPPPFRTRDATFSRWPNAYAHFTEQLGFGLLTQRRRANCLAVLIPASIFRARF